MGLFRDLDFIENGPRIRGMDPVGDMVLDAVEPETKRESGMPEPEHSAVPSKPAMPSRDPVEYSYHDTGFIVIMVVICTAVVMLFVWSVAK